MYPCHKLLTLYFRIQFIRERIQQPIRSGECKVALQVYGYKCLHYSKYTYKQHCQRAAMERA